MPNSPDVLVFVDNRIIRIRDSEVKASRCHIDDSCKEADACSGGVD